MSSVGDVVLNSRWYLVELRSCHQAVTLELAKLAGQRRWSYWRHPLCQFVETGFAVTAKAVKDSNFPATADHAREVSRASTVTAVDVWSVTFSNFLR